MSATVLREVRLYGELGRRFGRVFFLAVATPSEAAKALCAVLDGFERMFVGADGRQAYHVFVGRSEGRRDISNEQASEPLGANDPIRFVPVIAGAKRAGALQVIVGVVLVAVGALLTYFSAGALGAAGVPMMKLGAVLILGGVISMISTPRQGKTASNTDTPSYVFDGPINNTEQGGPVPLVFGRVITGSTVVSQGLSTESLIPTINFGAGFPGGFYGGLPGAPFLRAINRPSYEPRVPEDSE